MARLLAPVWLIAGLCLAPGVSAAQGLEVLVLDERERPIEAAQGQVGELRAVTGADGIMRFPLLPPGRFQLATRFIGYRPDIREVVPLAATCPGTSSSGGAGRVASLWRCSPNAEEEERTRCQDW